jgi:hypothetical protein
MSVSSGKRSRGSGLLLLVFIIGIFVWISRHQLVNAASGIFGPSKDSLGGEWVGMVDITGGYETFISNAPGPHKKAVIHFKLVMYDGFLEKYAGKGEIMIQGEAKPRAIHITTLGQPNNDGRISGTMYGDWGDGGDRQSAAEQYIEGRFQPNALTFTQSDSNGLQFSGVLHKGSDEEFQSLCKSLI